MSTYETMRARLQNAENLLEGSFALDNLAAVAAELDRIEALGIDYMPNRFFPTLAEGDDLTRAAANFGVERRPAACAEVTLTILGDPGQEIGEDVKAAAGEMIFACRETAVIPADGAVDVYAVCETAGSQGNVAAGALDEFVTAYEGLTSVTNAGQSYGGADEESDEALRSRVLARWQSPSTGGNRADYVNWAMEVSGVFRARAFNPSAGNVTVSVVAAGNTEAGEELLESVEAHIEENRPIGANVTVESGEAVVLNVAIQAEIDESRTAQSIQQEIAQALEAYIESISFVENRVSYLKIADLLFVEGVLDVVSYTINGSDDSITLEETQFPQLGEVTVNGA